MTRQFETGLYKQRNGTSEPTGHRQNTELSLYSWTAELRPLDPGGDPLGWLVEGLGLEYSTRYLGVIASAPDT